MKLFRSILVILAVGSLWGFFEALPLPTGLLTGLGVFFLLCGRQLLHTPGSSLAVAFVVCVYKAYSFHFSSCQWAGVLAIAAPFDLIASWFWYKNPPALRDLLLTGSASSLIALPGFLLAVLYIVPEPYWIDGGTSRIIGYVLRTTLPALAISLLAAPASQYLVKSFAKRELSFRYATGLASAMIVVIWFSPLMKL